MEEKKEEKVLKMNFFNKVWNSIVKIEKYPDMAAEGLGKAITYMCKIVAILAIVLCLGILYQAYQTIEDGVNYLENEFPDFSYKDGILTINSEDAIIISEDNSILGKTIIDTKVEDEQEINKYINSVEESGSGIIVLKNRVILKNAAVSGTINYNYQEVSNQMGLTQFTKQDVINYVRSVQVINIYLSISLTIFVYSFIMYLLTTASNAILLSVFGYLTSLIARMKMRYVAIFNMSVYALTLSIILNILYIGVNIFIDFNMEYFQVMYTAVAAIYLVAAIFILKTEFMKKQAELMKIAEAQAIIKKELEEEQEEKEKQEKKDKEDKKREEKEKDKDKEEKKKEEDNNINDGAEGSNA